VKRKKTKVKPNSVILDFMDAERYSQPDSFFYGNWLAFKISREIPPRQLRKCYKHGAVPSQLFVWMKVDRMIRDKERIPKGTVSLAQLLDFLRMYDYESEQARSKGEFLYREILKHEIPMLRNRDFSLADGLWMDLENFGVGIRQNKVRL